MGWHSPVRGGIGLIIGDDVGFVCRMKTFGAVNQHSTLHKWAMDILSVDEDMSGVCDDEQGLKKTREAHRSESILGRFRGNGTARTNNQDTSFRNGHCGRDVVLGIWGKV